MTGAAEQLYSNHLKEAYSAGEAGRRLAITSSSCYELGEETAWLVAELPAAGTEKDYLAALAALGINDPRRIFDKLLSIGVLREKGRKTWRGILYFIFHPKIRLISSRAQERALRLLAVDQAVMSKHAVFLSALALAGLLWGGALLLAGPGRVLPAAASGGQSGLLVFLLVIAASLVHELGHSLAAAASGIGLRPIGFSVYLIYPVFYTNVSGIDKLGLKQKALIDCGGFISQFIFVLLLLLFSALFGSPAAAEAARWTTAIILFNMNPFLRTDGYWLYKDIYSELKAQRWARLAHYLYLTLFFAFSAYFLWLVAGMLGGLKRELELLVRSPGYLFTGGYRIILGVYFALLGLGGGLKRFNEGKQEWQELRKERGVQACSSKTSAGSL